MASDYLELQSMATELKENLWAMMDNLGIDDKKLKDAMNYVLDGIDMLEDELPENKKD